MTEIGQGVAFAVADLFDFTSGDIPSIRLSGLAGDPEFWKHGGSFENAFDLGCGQRALRGAKSKV